MGRPRKYQTDAERQRAYRDRRRTERQRATAPRRPPRDSTAGAVIRWARQSLIVPAGHPLAGRPFRIARFQESIIRDVLDPQVHEVCACMARKNAKSATIAIILLAYLAGPLRRPGFEAGVLSVTRPKAQKLLRQVEQIAIASKLAGLTFKRSPWPGSIESESGSVEIEAATHAGGSASGYNLSICDELGLFKEPAREAVVGMRGALGATGGKFVSLSIFGSGPFIPEILDREGEPGLRIHLWQGDPELAIDDPENWKLANPGLSPGIKHRAKMRQEARRVLRVPADQGYFRSHHLNLPGSDHAELVVSLDSWRQCERVREELPPRAGPCYLGADLGSTLSLTSVAAFWPDSGRLEVFTAAGDQPKADARGRNDAVGSLYARAVDRGDLWLFSGKLVPIRPILERVRRELAGEHVAVIGTDRFRYQELQQHLTALAVPWRVVYRGSGVNAVHDTSRDIRAFQTRVEGGELRTAPNLLMVNGLGQSTLLRDGDGVPLRIVAARVKARIDCVIAAATAVGLASTRPPARKRPYHVAMA